jgi:intein/homing endonuclease
MAKDLINLGCVNKKSLVLQFPDESIIPKFFIFSFIRGYFDGDGCIHLLNKGLNAVISFVGTNIFLQKLKLLLEEYGINCNIYKINHSQAYQLSFSSKQSVEIFYNLIYPNKNVINLNRKHEKFLNYFEIKNENLLKNFKKSKHKWFDKRRNTWHVEFTKNKKRIRFGPFKTEKEADLAKLNYEEQNKIGYWN